MQNTETVPLQPIVVGRYYDTFGRDEDGWYFTERKVDVQMIGDVSAHLMIDPRVSTSSAEDSPPCTTTCACAPATRHTRPDAFTIHRREVPASHGRDGLTLAYVHEGLGGYPLLLLHGYPETKRIWWRNIAALAEAGYEVIAPDLRGYGDSDVSAADVYDLAAWSRDFYLLVHDVLGHEHCGVVGGDLGGVVAVDLAAPLPGVRGEAGVLRLRAAVRLRRLRRGRHRRLVDTRDRRRPDERLPLSAGRDAR